MPGMAAVILGVGRPQRAAIGGAKGHKSDGVLSPSRRQRQLWADRERTAPIVENDEPRRSGHWQLAETSGGSRVVSVPPVAYTRPAADDRFLV
jgi:hypothetical protein